MPNKLQTELLSINYTNNYVELMINSDKAKKYKDLIIQNFSNIKNMCLKLFF